MYLTMFKQFGANRTCIRSVDLLADSVGKDIVVLCRVVEASLSRGKGE